MSRLTLRDRVTVTSVLVLALGIGAIGLLFNVLLAHRLDADASAVLRSRAAAQRATLDLSHGRVRTVEGPSDAALDREAWVVSNGRVIERPVTETSAEARAVADLADVPRTTERTVAGDVRLRASPVRAASGERRGTVVVGVSRVPYEHTRNIALLGTVILSLILLVAATVAVRLAMRFALNPIAEMTARAADWSEHDLHQRFHLGPPRDELTALAATFDGLLRRIEAVLRREQRFSAEVAHELRTPLTGLRGEAELALLGDDLDDDARAAFERVLEGSSRMQNVIDTLLASARMEATDASGSCDPLPAVREAVTAVAGAARARHLDVHVAEPLAPLVVDADAGVVTQALYPLIENGVRHARSGVAVELAPSNGHVVVSVRDDGAGVGDGDPDALFSPGVSSSGGAGLGLPLARRLARSAGGDVVAQRGAGGGVFELRLPGGAAPS